MSDLNSTQGSLFSDISDNDDVTTGQLRKATPAQPLAPRPKYFIDTNCLITPYNDYYRPTFKLSRFFWDKLYELVENHTIGLLRPV